MYDLSIACVNCMIIHGSLGYVFLSPVFYNKKKEKYRLVDLKKLFIHYKKGLKNK